MTNLDVKVIIKRLSLPNIRIDVFLILKEIMMNKKLYTQFLNAASTMLVLENYDYDIQKLNEQIKDSRISIQKAKDKIKTSKKYCRALTVWGIIVTASGAQVSILLFAEFAKFAPIVFSMLPVGIFMIVMAIVRRRVVRKKFRKEFEETEANLVPAIEEMEAKILQLEAEKVEFMTGNANTLEFLPYSYHNIQAIGFMLKAIENLRADNITDVINLYEQELHYLEQTRILTNHMEMQRIYNENIQYALESIKRNQQQINSNIRLIQVMEIVDDLL